MRSLQPIARVALVFVLICVTNAGNGLRAQTPKSTAQPRPVQVTGDDYRFVDFPATLQPGLTVFSFRNQGRVRHEINIVLLKAELTADEINKRMQSDAAFLRSTDVTETAWVFCMLGPANRALVGCWSISCGVVDTL